jgi:hypothetical protein
LPSIALFKVDYFLLDVCDENLQLALHKLDVYARNLRLGCLADSLEVDKTEIGRSKGPRSHLVPML